MTTPDEQLVAPVRLGAPMGPENENQRRWRERAENAWPHSVPVIEALHDGQWVDLFDTFPAHLIPVAMRVVGFAYRGTERRTLLEVHCEDCVRAFEGALHALPQYLAAREPGTLTKVVERSELRERVEAVEGALKTTHRVDNLLEALTKRVAELEREPLPADVRVLSDRIGAVEDRVGDAQAAFAGGAAHQRRRPRSASSRRSTSRSTLPYYIAVQFNVAKGSAKTRGWRLGNDADDDEPGGST